MLEVQCEQTWNSTGDGMVGLRRYTYDVPGTQSGVLQLERSAGRTAVYAVYVLYTGTSIL